jgi:Flp pilus assembly pilin Flp
MSKKYLIISGGSMFKQLLKNKKAQNTAEYALLIALVVAGVIAMQTYAQRALQARLRDESQYMATTTDFSGNGAFISNQYEPYYMQSQYDVGRNSESNKRLAEGTTAYDAATNRVRTGNEQSTYNQELGVTGGSNSGGL